MSKKTLVVGASAKPERYSHIAVKLLSRYGYPVVPLGLRKGEVDGRQIETERKDFTGIHTVTMYIGPQRQPDYYDYLLSLKPKRFIFNPGTENEEFIQKLEGEGIEVVEHCTLQMLHAEIF